MSTHFTYVRENAGHARDQAFRAPRAAAAVTLPYLRRLFLEYANRCDADADRLESDLVH